MHTTNSSPLSALSFLFFLILLSSCTSELSPIKRSEALLRASHYVDLYGQIISEKQTNYLDTLKSRLEGPLQTIGKVHEPFKLILLQTNHPISLSAGSGVILISRGFIKLMSSEAELAFVLAHEMAHDVLGHYQTIKPEESSNQNDNESLEIDADEFAIVIMISAGYDPRYAIASIKSAYASKETLPLSEYGYPSLEDRISHIQDKIAYIEWRPPGTIDRRDFQVFKRSIAN